MKFIIGVTNGLYSSQSFYFCLIVWFFWCNLALAIRHTFLFDSIYLKYQKKSEYETYMCIGLYLFIVLLRIIYIYLFRNTFINTEEESNTK